jgi:glutamate-1-semialdehyde aminotransferase
MRRYLAKTPKSKAYAQQHRAHLADARTVSGFRPLLKELIYPIVTDRSEGPWVWDLDGNRYIDTTNGFGSVFFGHRPQFVADAVSAQMTKGWEIGPQTPLAGECAELFSAMTGLPRVTFCNTGSEAVLAALRVSRTVTGRNLVVMFNGDYHGIFDEVIVRGAGSRSLPAAPGIPPESVANTLLLDYGVPKTLEVLRQRADEIAAVLIEPVQSRRPDWQPRDFLHEVRQITRDCGAAMIMDEVITGFRAAPGGAQEYFGVQGDIGTYGKVFGGGLPIGAIAGIPRFMDALDGGHWQFGDDSVPEAGVTYFAGTFVRHPLVLAGVKACLEYLRDHPGAQQRVARRTEQMVDTINTDFRKSGAPLHLARFTSLWKPEYSTDQGFGDLLYFFLREAGVHIWDGRPCFLTMAHDDEACEGIIEGFRYAVAEMQKGGFFEGGWQAREVFEGNWRSPYRRPLPGARIGRDAAGNPAWYVPDTAQPGHWRRVELRPTGT